MKVGPVSVDKKGNLSVVSADVEWDTHPGLREHLYVAVPSEFADFLSPWPHVFLLAALMSAGMHGETRVQLDEPTVAGTEKDAGRRCAIPGPV